MSPTVTPGCLVRTKRYVHGQDRPGFACRALFMAEPGELAVVVSSKTVGGCVLVVCCEKLAWIAGGSLEDA